MGPKTDDAQKEAAEIAQGYFATEIFALSAVFSASFAEDVRFSGISLDALVLPVVGTALLFAVILLAPLLVFAPRLVEAKLRGLREYWELAAGRPISRPWPTSGVASRSCAGCASCPSA